MWPENTPHLPIRTQAELRRPKAPTMTQYVLDELKARARQKEENFINTYGGNHGRIKGASYHQAIQDEAVVVEGTATVNLKEEAVWDPMYLNHIAIINKALNRQGEKLSDLMELVAGLVSIISEQTETIKDLMEAME